MTRTRTRTSTTTQPAGDPRVANLAVDADRLRRMWAMAPDERVQAAEQGQLSLGEMLAWARRAPRRGTRRRRRVLLHPPPAE